MPHSRRNYAGAHSSAAPASHAAGSFEPSRWTAGPTPGKEARCASESRFTQVIVMPNREVNMKRLLRLALAVAFALTFASGDDAFAQGKKRFIAIGTGGPTGVYFATGNAICRLVHKEAAEGRKKGRKHGIRCSAPSTGGSTYNIGQISVRFSRSIRNRSTSSWARIPGSRAGPT
jgi:hypothetical protein